MGGRGCFVDLAISFEHPLAATGFTGFQLTGPTVHNNVAPFPGTFSLGVDDRLPGLIVLLDATVPGAKNCQNIANLFNLTGVTDIKEGIFNDAPAVIPDANGDGDGVCDKSDLRAFGVASNIQKAEFFINP